MDIHTPPGRLWHRWDLPCMGAIESRPGDGDSRPPDLTEVAVAEPL
jgi:hypothetical protein